MLDEEPDGCRPEAWEGAMRGTGATLLSGRVRVFARRIVGADVGGCLALVVGIGTSVKS